jgi:hypothetical protein
MLAPCCNTKNYQSSPFKLLETVNITSKLVKGFHTGVKKRMCEVHGLYKDLVMTLNIQTWTCPEGSRRLRLPYFKTIGT